MVNRRRFWMYNSLIMCVCVLLFTETLMTSMKESLFESWSAFSCSSEFIATRSCFSACRRATWERRASSSALWLDDTAWKWHRTSAMRNTWVLKVLYYDHFQGSYCHLKCLLPKFTRLNVKKQTNTCFILESVSLMPPFLKSQYWGKGCHYDTSSIYYMQHLILIYNPKGI